MDSSNQEVLTKLNSDTEKAKVVEAPLLCSYRAALALISFLGFVNMYALRVDMSVALVCMINHTAVSTPPSEFVDSNVSVTSPQCERDADDSVGPRRVWCSVRCVVSWLSLT